MQVFLLNCAVSVACSIYLLFFSLLSSGVAVKPVPYFNLVVTSSGAGEMICKYHL